MARSWLASPCASGKPPAEKTQWSFVELDSRIHRSAACVAASSVRTPVRDGNSENPTTSTGEPRAAAHAYSVLSRRSYEEAETPMRTWRSVCLAIADARVRKLSQ